MRGGGKQNHPGHPSAARCGLGQHKLAKGATSSPRSLAADLTTVIWEFSSLLVKVEDKLKHFRCSNWKNVFELSTVLFSDYCVTFFLGEFKAISNIPSVITAPLEISCSTYMHAACSCALIWECWPVVSEICLFKCHHIFIIKDHLKYLLSRAEVRASTECVTWAASEMRTGWRRRRREPGVCTGRDCCGF